MRIVPRSEQNRRQRRQAEPNRTCTHPGCTTILSRYNTRTECWPHTKRTKAPSPRGSNK